jgi:hypothetical protein
MIKVELKVECGDDLQRVVELLSRGIDLVQSSHTGEDCQSDIEVVESTGRLSVTFLSDTRETFNAPTFSCCK